MNSQIDVSVVIPARDMETWIGDTLGSVQQQVTGIRLEVLVVDDGSKDGTRAAAEAAARNGSCTVRVLESSGQGPSAARNVGWRGAQGPWVQFLDADDLLATGKVARQFQIARQMSKGVALVWSPWADLLRRGDEWVVSPVLRGGCERSDPLLAVIASDGFIPFGAALVRREWLEVIGGFDESLHLVEDVDLQIRLIAAGGRFVGPASEGPEFFYRRRVGSLSGGSRREFVEACVRNVNRVRAHLEARGALEERARRELAGHYAGAARAYLDWDKARAVALFEAVRCLEPHYLPVAPPRLRALSRILGFERAAIVAAFARRAGVRAP